MVQQRDHFLQKVLVQKIFDSFFCSVGQVGKGPANICYNVLFVILNQYLNQGWNCSSNKLVLRLRPSSAKVWESPWGISQEAGTSYCVVQHICDFIKSSTSQNAVSGRWAISSDVSNTPNDLLYNLNLRWLEELDKVAQHILFNQIGYMIGSSGGNVCQTPCGFKLKLRNVVVKQRNKGRNQVGVYHCLDWWIVLNR